jgi:adenosine deaminase
MLIADIDRAYGPGPGLEMVERLIELIRAGAPGTDRVLGIGMDSTELGVDPTDFVAAFELAGRSGLRRTSHQGEVTPPTTIRAGIEVLGCERIDHGLSLMADPDLTRRFVDERIPLTVCPNSNIRIANAYPRLDEHPYRQMREAGLLATLNTDDPALTDLDLTAEYRSVMAAFDYRWADMVDIALDGVAASWLDRADARDLETRIATAASELEMTLDHEEP